MYDTKKQGYERSKRLRNKKINQGSCIQTVSDKRLQHSSPEGNRKKSEFIKRITRAYLNLILQAEYFYPGFNGAFNEITNKEIKLWERIFVRAVETKEIRSDVNPSILALTFRILLFGKCFQDALVNGLRIEELKAVLYNQYELIKN